MNTRRIPKDSGKRVKFKFGAIRENTIGEGRYDMMLTRAIHRVALRYELGGIKYGDSDNFLKGQPLRVYVGHALKHIYQGLQGLQDEDHWGAAAWNILALMETQDRIKEGLLPKELDNLSHLEVRDDTHHGS